MAMLKVIVVLIFVAVFTSVSEISACSLCGDRTHSAAKSTENHEYPTWVCDATHRNEVVGCPKPSNIPMRSLRPWYSPQPRNVSHGEGPGIGLYDTWGAARAFNVDRIDWVYSTNTSFVTDARAHNMKSISLSINGNLPDAGPGETYNIGRAEDIQGRPLTAPWMSSWPNPPMFGCINKKAYVDIVYTAVDELLQAGVDAIQHDDPGTNGETVLFNRGDPNKSGCYCEFCMAGFANILTNSDLLNSSMKQELNLSVDFSYKQYILSHNKTVLSSSSPSSTSLALLNYQQPTDPTHELLRSLFVTFQQNSTESYIGNLRSHINNSTSRKIPLSCNNGGRWTTPYYMCDFGLGELSIHESTPGGLESIFQTMVPAGRLQMMTMPKAANITAADVGVLRWAMATAYSLGGNMLIPWDIYLPTPSAKRYYGIASDFIDIITFIQTNSIALDTSVAMNDTNPLYSDFKLEYTGNGGDGKRFRLPKDTPPSEGSCATAMSLGSCESLCVSDNNCVAIFSSISGDCCILYQPLKNISGTAVAGESYVRQRRNSTGLTPFAVNDTSVSLRPRKATSDHPLQPFLIHVLNDRDQWRPTLGVPADLRHITSGRAVVVTIANKALWNKVDCYTPTNATLLTVGSNPTALAPATCDVQAGTISFVIPTPVLWSIIKF